MLRDRIPVKVLAARIISQVDDGMRKSLGLTDDERSVALLTTDCDDASYVAVDEATKMAAVRVVYAKSFYAGAGNASTAYAGEFIGMLAAASPAEARSGLDAALECLRGDCCFLSANDEDTVPYFAHCIARTGTFLSEQAKIPEGSPMAYLIAPPLEAMVALDAALKAADVKLVEFYGPPTETNFAGGLLTGDQAACRAACAAFAETVIEVAAEPQRY